MINEIAGQGHTGGGGRELPINKIAKICGGVLAEEEDVVPLQRTHSVVHQLLLKWLCDK